MIQVLLFDIHEVFFVHSHVQWEAILHDFCVPHEALHEARYVGGIWEEYKRGRMTEDMYWETVCSHLPETFRGTPDSLRDRMDRVDLLDDELLRFVRTLQGRYRIAALSNAGADLERRLEHFGIDKLFETVINSHRVQMAKPEESIYQLAAERLGVKPGNILFIDDRERNTKVAAALGFHTHVYSGVSGFAEVMAAYER